ncbi:MAG: DNA primase, partial [Candidatus Hydrogenedentes bacterium]|nr:DNA primase [Candidatus Hydrogenedentota bacterium]
MRKYSQEIVAEVIAANDIVDVIGGVLELKRSGSSRFVALCPFHQEKTPSFSVSRERQMFHCFGCGKSGDVITFIREYEGLSFGEAVRKLADRGGVRLPALTEWDNKEDQQRSQLLELGAFAAKFFRDTLGDPLKGGPGRTYLKSRQLKDETVKQFGLGYAPDSWNAFRDAARAAKFSEELLLAAGLVRKGERGSCYDFFRNRLMFPIRDVSGNYVAFGGRNLGKDEAAKYVNSQENAVYRKSRTLYGLHQARPALRQAKRAILVEGYFDLLRCFDAGICNVVAPCGTALTPEQAKVIGRYVREVVVVFDGDTAGVQAALRAVSVLTAAGLTARALALPAGQDPDDFILGQGPQRFADLVEEAPDFVTFYVRMNQARLTTIEGRTDVARELFGILTGLDDVLKRDEYLKRVAHELQLSPYAVQQEFEKTARQAEARRRPADSDEPEAVAMPALDDSEFIALLLISEPARDLVKTELEGVALPPGPLGEVLQHVLDDAAPGLGSRLESEAARRLYAAAANRDKPPSEKMETLVPRRVSR